MFLFTIIIIIIYTVIIIDTCDLRTLYNQITRDLRESKTETAATEICNTSYLYAKLAAFTKIETH